MKLLKEGKTTVDLKVVMMGEHRRTARRLSFLGHNFS
jgi:hypothetical protein